MFVFRCPECGRHSVVWDSRSRTLLCRNHQCGAAFEPPTETENCQTVGPDGLLANFDENATADWLCNKSPLRRCEFAL